MISEKTVKEELGSWQMAVPSKLVSTNLVCQLKYMILISQEVDNYPNYTGTISVSHMALITLSTLVWKCA